MTDQPRDPFGRFVGLSKEQVADQWLELQKAEPLTAEQLAHPENLSAAQIADNWEAVAKGADHWKQVAADEAAAVARAEAVAEYQRQAVRAVGTAIGEEQK